jgi:TFIIF-interacting CTD phosphatase-like protein
LNENKAYVKDLAIIGRQLKSTLIVDNTKENFMYQKQNGIHIKDWIGDNEYV